MFVVEKRQTIPRWYYIAFGIVMLLTGSFGALLTMHVNWRSKTRQHPPGT